MDRRKFIKGLLAGTLGVAAVAAIDPEELLWKPGKKAFSKAPAPKTVNEMVWNFLSRPHMDDLFNPPQRVVDSFYSWRFGEPLEWDSQAVSKAAKALAGRIDADAMLVYRDVYDNASVIKTATEAQLRMNTINSQILQNMYVAPNNTMLIRFVDVVHGFSAL